MTKMSETELLHAVWTAQRHRPEASRGMSILEICRQLGVGAARGRELVREGLRTGHFRRVTRTSETLNGRIVQTVGYEAIRPA